MPTPDEIMNWSFSKGRGSMIQGRKHPIEYRGENLELDVFTDRETGEIDTVQVRDGNLRYYKGDFFLLSDDSVYRFGPQGSSELMTEEQKKRMLELMFEIVKTHHGEPFPPWVRPIWSRAVAFCRG